VEAIVFHAEGERWELPTDLVVIHEGVVPNDQMTRQLGCREAWDPGQRCFRPEVDPWGETSLPGIFAAGDCAGITGARAAELSGEIAVLEIARQLGLIGQDERDRRALGPRRHLDRERAFRPFLEMLYPPRIAQAGRADDETIICRCEEVTAGQIRNAIAVGVSGPDQLKSFTRCGMGPCQGRSCSLAVAEIIAAETNRPIGDIGRHEIRSPLKPIPLGLMAREACDMEHS
jgi:NAD(P)H-nitrite reductase large subunit